jgi:hypothetical protein
MNCQVPSRANAVGWSTPNRRSPDAPRAIKALDMSKPAAALRPLEPVGAPSFAADAVVDGEKAAGIVAALDG